MRVAPIPIHIFQVKLFQLLKHLLPPLLSTSNPSRRLAAEERPTLIVVGRASRRADAVAVPGASAAPGRLGAGLDDLLDRRDDLGAVQPDVRQVVVAQGLELADRDAPLTPAGDTLGKSADRGLQRVDRPEGTDAYDPVDLAAWALGSACVSLLEVAT